MQVITLKNWLLLVSGLSLFGALCGLYDPHYIRISQFSLNPNEVTPFSGRLFGAWTMLACILRAHCAFHLNEKGIYRTTIWSFFIALLVYGYEVFVSGTAPLNTSLAPFTIASISILWMTKEYRKNLYPEVKKGKKK